LEDVCTWEEEQAVKEYPLSQVLLQDLQDVHLPQELVAAQP
jgi:hypothetical protein